MRDIYEVIAEMADYLEQEYEPSLDKLEQWMKRLEIAAQKAEPQA